MFPDYSTITELPGNQVTKLQLRRSYSRYKFAASFCEGKDVLEVACGGGQGLGLLSKAANRVVGGDCEKRNLEYALKTYEGRSKIEIVDLDAHSLQFDDKSFDVILLYEAIYYLESPMKFLGDCERILRENGLLIICTANKDWHDFNPSPYCHKYFSVPELRKLCEENGFDVEFYGGFPDYHDTLSSKIKSGIKKLAVKYDLMPKTMKGKVFLKKFFYGDMIVLPYELEDGVVDYEPPNPIPGDKIDTIHTAIYAVARR